MEGITVLNFLKLAERESSELCIRDYYTGTMSKYSVHDLLEDESPKGKAIKSAKVYSWEYDQYNILLLLNIDTTTDDDEEDEET